MAANTSLTRINLAQGGRFVASGESKSSPADVDAIFAHLRAQEKPHLVLYFHGGRVSEEGGHRTADALFPLFHDEVGAHPLFFIWESSELEVLRARLSQIAKEPLFQEIQDTVIKFVLSKLKVPQTGRSVGGKLRVVNDAEVEAAKAEERTGADEVADAQRDHLEEVNDIEAEQFENYLGQKPEFEQEAGHLAVAVAPPQQGARGAASASISGPTPDLTLLSDEVVQELKSAVEATPHGRGLVSQTVLLKKGVNVFRRVIGRILKKTDHGVYVTVVEELLRELYIGAAGGFIWKAMKDEIEGAFGDNAGRTGDNLYGGTYFIERLHDFLVDPASPELKVSLVGHSAGSIYICRLVEEASRRLPRSFRFHHIVFLAPGVDFELFRRAIVDRPERFTHFRMYTMRDVHEAQDQILSVIYPRSLLYFVSGLLEGDEPRPIVGMERFYSGAPPYDSPSLLAVRQFMEAPGERRVVWSKTGNDALEGLICEAVNHGGFADEPTTRKSLAYLLRS